MRAIRTVLSLTLLILGVITLAIPLILINAGTRIAPSPRPVGRYF